MVTVPTVFVVDPDSRFVKSCQRLLENCQVEVVAYDAPSQFFQLAPRSTLGCIVSELQFVGENGIDFCQRLKQEGWMLPIVIHTAFADVSSCARAFRSGVTDYLEKTIPPDILIRRIVEILTKCTEDHNRWLSHQSMTGRLASLTEREREVVRALVAGQAMKEIAKEFGTSFQSVARHRQRILAKLSVENDVALANLLRGYRWPIADCESPIEMMLPLSVEDVLIGGS